VPNSLPASLVAAAILACGLGLGLVVILLRKIAYLQKLIEQHLKSVDAKLDFEFSDFSLRENRREPNNQNLINDKLNVINTLLQGLKGDLVHEIKILFDVERGSIKPQEMSFVQELTPAIENSQSTEAGPLSEVLPEVTALQVGEEALALLGREGRTNAIASISGLTAWLNANWSGFIGEAILTREEAWLVTVVAKSQDKQGVVIPALDTVIGAGAVSDWFECRGYDGTRVLNRQNVVQLAEAARDDVGKPWRVAKKGLISREVGVRD
jgi:hypothetical protein